MWEYQKEIISLKDPDDYEIVSKMDKLGRDGWEIFSISEKIVEEYLVYGDPRKTIEYTMYMKKPIKTNNLSNGNCITGEFN